ncbi:MAG: SPASM domain-containing protein, partial [Candidatus Hydrogenedentota bacterium]
MAGPALHRFELDGRRFAIDPETCFCFECDEICWDVLALYPATTISRIVHELKPKHSEREIYEVVGELEWLRNVKSILPRVSVKELQERYEIEDGLKRLTVELPPPASPETASEKRRWFQKSAERTPDSVSSIGHDAAHLLLDRAGNQKALELEFLEQGHIHDLETVATLCAHALRAARLAAKELTAAVRVHDINIAPLSEALRNHTISARLEFRAPENVRDYLKPLARGEAFSLAQLKKALEPGAGDVRGRIVVRPDTADFGEVVQTLDEAGFKVIELDLDATFVAHPDMPPADMLPGLSASAVYYARRLLEGHYFRLDPIASLFYRIYEGQPVQRSDPIGTNELGIDKHGDVYASWRVFGKEQFRHGSLRENAIDEAGIKRYEDMGVPTTGPCLRCWARHLCGGGRAAVHGALSGHFHRPHEPWCDAQRSWMAAAVSAFNTLSDAGVNFTRIYQTLTPTARKRPGLSMFSMLRAAISLAIRMRPVEESDAEMLVRWENWNA